MKKKVGLIDTGTSNIKSVFYALKLFDSEVVTIDSYTNKKIDLAKKNKIKVIDQKILNKMLN